MNSVTLTKKQARRFLLTHQGLWPPYEVKGKAGILDFIHRVGCIQFDPLNIVGHNPDLVLQARVSNFRPVMLQELLYKLDKMGFPLQTISSGGLKSQRMTAVPADNRQNAANADQKLVEKLTFFVLSGYVPVSFQQSPSITFPFENRFWAQHGQK